MTYANRLKTCVIESLEYRRKVTDLIMLYKIVNKKVSLEPKKYLVRSSRNRFNKFQLQKRVHTSRTENNFFIRTVNIWNQLSDEIIHAPSVSSFIKQLKQSNVLNSQP